MWSSHHRIDHVSALPGYLVPVLLDRLEFLLASTDNFRRDQSLDIWRLVVNFAVLFYFPRVGLDVSLKVVLFREIEELSDFCGPLWTSQARPLGVRHPGQFGLAW